MTAMLGGRVARRRICQLRTRTRQASGRAVAATYSRISPVPLFSVTWPPAGVIATWRLQSPHLPFTTISRYGAAAQTLISSFLCGFSNGAWRQAGAAKRARHAASPLECLPLPRVGSPRYPLRALVLVPAHFYVGSGSTPLPPPLSRQTGRACPRAAATPGTFCVTFARANPENWT